MADDEEMVEIMFRESMTEEETRLIVLIAESNGEVQILQKGNKPIGVRGSKAALLAALRTYLS